MKTLAEVYTEYINYLERTGEEITFEEWKTTSGGKLREYEPAVQKYIKYGLAAIIGLGVLSKISVGLYAIYRRNSDYCIKKCGGHGVIKAKGTVTAKCYNTCYAQASLAVLNRIKSDLSVVNKIEDQKKREKVIKKLKKEQEKWQDRYERHKLRAETAPTALVSAGPAGVYKKRGKK